MLDKIIRNKCLLRQSALTFSVAVVSALMCALSHVGGTENIDFASFVMNFQFGSFRLDCKRKPILVSSVYLKSPEEAFCNYSRGTY